MDLTDGEIHETDVQKTGMYRKIVFKKHRIAMNARQFSFQQSTGVLRGEREMGVDTMRSIVDSLQIEKVRYLTSLKKEANKYFFLDSTVIAFTPVVNPPKSKRLMYIRALEKLKSAKNVIISNYSRVEWGEREIEKYEVEIYKKYALPAACIVFVLIGAPLGVMVKKGGFGMAASISLFFFLLYWAFLIGGEKLSERGFFSPFIGMWAANFLLTVLGIILTFKTNQETVTVQFTFLKKLVPKKFRYQTNDVNNENTR